jgi:hypothetical protein
MCAGYLKNFLAVWLRKSYSEVLTGFCEVKTIDNSKIVSVTIFRELVRKPPVTLNFLSGSGSGSECCL